MEYHADFAVQALAVPGKPLPDNGLMDEHRGVPPARALHG